MTIDTDKLKALALAAQENDFANGSSLTSEFLAFMDECRPATVLELIAERDELIAEVERLRADAKRYRWLMENKVRMRTADSYGPACPALEFFADRWNERPDLSPQERIDMEISAAIEREKE